MRRAAIVAAGLVVLLAVTSQVFLPRLAEHRLRSKLRRYGQVESVHVSAFPAVELLWGDADDVRIRLASYRSGQRSLTRLLDRTRHTDRLDVRVERGGVGPLELRDVTLRKRGAQLSGGAELTDAALRASLPPGLDIRPVASGGGELVVQGSFGGFTARARLVASDGRLKIEPDVPFGGALALTVFDDPGVAVQGVSAARLSDGYRLSARARLR